MSNMFDYKTQGEFLRQLRTKLSDDKIQERFTAVLQNFYERAYGFDKPRALKEAQGMMAGFSLHRWMLWSSLSTEHGEVLVKPFMLIAMGKPAMSAEEFQEEWTYEQVRKMLANSKEATELRAIHRRNYVALWAAMERLSSDSRPVGTTEAKYPSDKDYLAASIDGQSRVAYYKELASQPPRLPRPMKRIF
jgi:hypothetical protein